jgi:hypothetical protein
VFNKDLRDKIILRPIAMFFDEPVSCLKLLRDLYVKSKKRNPKVFGHFVSITQRKRYTVWTIIRKNDTNSLNQSLAPPQFGNDALGRRNN